MRFTLAGGALLCLLVAHFPLNKAGVVPAHLECRTLDCVPANSIGWSVSGDLSRRAGGGGGGKPPPGGKPDDPNSNGGGSGGGGNGGGGDGSPQSDGGQVGDEGGFQTHETEGGFGDPCRFPKRSWPLFWKRVPAQCNSKEEGESEDGDPQPNAPVDNPPDPPAIVPANPPAIPPANPPANNLVDPPSARNNYGQPAQSQQQTYHPAPVIDIGAKVADIRNKIQKTPDLQNGHWFFWSGFEDRKIAFEAGDILSARLGITKTAYKFNYKTQKDEWVPRMAGLEDVLPIPTMDMLRKELTDAGNGNYYWASVSKAYAQAITGTAYVVIPKGRPINKPKDNGDGSVWWSFEAPELSRNPDIDRITYVWVDPVRNEYSPTGPDFDIGPDTVIWQRGDEPLGTPGNELHKEEAPSDRWWP